MIVDEEQRFGVEHKEHITALRTHVDVLTLSRDADPADAGDEPRRASARCRRSPRRPRTATPRSPTSAPTTTSRSPPRSAASCCATARCSTCTTACRRSTGRRGKIRELVPEARVAVAHGQMNEDLLERTVNGFWHNEFDVLVCTTIVENGLDISNANTLVVERSDTLGLSQLHQLRGRVGRGRERGYAYFLFPPEHPLTETAHDRLATIAQHSELGSGTAVAMKDLEIRGAGNILGAEQSGHIAGVGFDLYIRLVGEAVAAFRAGGRRGRGRRGGAARRGAGRPARSTRTSRTTTSRGSGCGWRSTARSPRQPTPRRSTRSSTSSPTATASRRRRCATCSRSPRSGSAAAPSAWPRWRWRATASGSARSTCPTRPSCGSSGCTRRPRTRPPRGPSSCRGRWRAAGSAVPRCATSSCWTGAPPCCATCWSRPRCQRPS